MYVHEHPPDRHRADLQIRRALIVTQTGFWLVALLLFMAVTPLLAPGVWPLIANVEIAHGQRVPDEYDDVYITVVASGEIFVDEKPAADREVVAALQKRGVHFFVRVDRNAPFRSVRRIVRAAREADCRRLTFVGKAAPVTEGFSLNHRWW